jgi:hypothetical protein
MLICFDSYVHLAFLLSMACNSVILLTQASASNVLLLPAVKKKKKKKHTAKASVALTGKVLFLAVF